MSQYTLLPEKNYQISGFFFRHFGKNIFLKMSQYAFLPEKNPNLRVGFFRRNRACSFFPTTLKLWPCRLSWRFSPNPSPCPIVGVQSWRGQSSRVQMAGQLQKLLLLYVAAKKTAVCTSVRSKRQRVRKVKKVRKAKRSRRSKRPKRTKWGKRSRWVQRRERPQKGQKGERCHRD